MGDLIRRYPSGSSDFGPTDTQVQVSYTVAGTDGSSVNGTINTNMLLTDDQIDELCVALQGACEGLPWVVTSLVQVQENGRRTFTVSEPPPQG
jgi:hypothetical protein